MWLKILRQNISHLARRAKGSASIEQKNGSTKSNKTNNNGAEVNRNEDNQNGSIDIKSQAKKKSGGPGSGPLLQQAEVSSSQLDFFKMLDEKIENGPDYDESLDATMRAERISELMRRWELASMSWSSVNDLNNSTMGLLEPIGLGGSRNSLSAKDREGMRNIIGGRPESAPVFVRNANRVDGLQEVNTPSPNMPRHVLESITQSPTQSLKNGPNSGGLMCNSESPTSLRSSKEYNTKEYNANGPASVGGGGGPGGGGGGGGVRGITRSHYQSPGGPVNGEYVTQQALYREQYLQQTGIISIQPQYTGNSVTPVVTGNVLRKNPYVQQFQIATSPQHLGPPRKRGFNLAQMT